MVVITQYNIDYDSLLYLYCELKYSCGNIGKILGCSGSTIRRALKNHNIRIRNLSESHIGYKMPDSQKRNISQSQSGENHYLFGKKMDPEIIRKIVETKKRLFKEGKIKVWNKDMKGIHLNPKNEFKKGQIPWNKGKPHNESTKKIISEILRGKYKGDKASNWKGGITPISHIIRNSSEIKEWKRLVLSRDNYTCKLCNKRGGDLHIHHIKAFAKYPDDRYNIDNGITLCIECHRLVHSLNPLD